MITSSFTMVTLTDLKPRIDHLEKSVYTTTMTNCCMTINNAYHNNQDHLMRIELTTTIDLKNFIIGDRNVERQEGRKKSRISKKEERQTERDKGMNTYSTIKHVPFK